MITTESGQVRDEADRRHRCADPLSAISARDWDRLMDPFAADGDDVAAEASLRANGIAA
jgi:hypothetical protein